VRSETKLSRSFANGGFGARFSTERSGWDLSAFVYRSPDMAPTFAREVTGLTGLGGGLGLPALGGTATTIYRPTYDRLLRVGGTLAKDFDGLVLKAEACSRRGGAFQRSTQEPKQAGRAEHDRLGHRLEGTPAEGCA
jgi:hypothetical protein